MPYKAERIHSIERPEDFVSLLAGTFTDGNRFSTGNTLPLIGRPWAFNHWAPQTKDANRNAGSWWFSGNAHVFTWMRCTHQPSPWIGDWGWFVLGPQISSGDEGNRNPEYAWEPRSAVIKPYVFDALIAPHGIRIELVPTDHGAVLKVTFPRKVEGGGKKICLAESDWTSSGMSPTPYITGKNNKAKQDRMIISNFNLYIQAESKSAVGVSSNHDIACFRYSSDATTVEVRVATSLISQAQASVNLNRELASTKSFDDLIVEARSVWHKLLKRVDVVDAGELSDETSKHLTVFYSGLVRALSFPRRLDEVTAAGEVVHYSPYDPQGRVFPGPAVTDNGFWDTFRTVYPMLSLLYPDHLGVLIQGWLNAYKEGGWLPSWASPGYRNCMVGTYADVVVADAIVKGIQGFDYHTATDALLKDSFEEPPSFAGGAAGKEGLNEYVSRGYVAASDRDRGKEVVSRTLDFGFADFSVSRALVVLAQHQSNAERKADLSLSSSKLAERARRASTSLFSTIHRLMVPKQPSGESTLNFNPITWGNGFTEGNSWHHSFPPYALHELVALHGSKEKLLSKLHEMFLIPSTFGVGSYGQEIHEMTEMRALAMGQYGHNNQPVHHIPYLFAALGDRASTETIVRKLIDHAYGTDFYAGDEDNGEQGAWFVLSALGLFSIAPGTPDYILGSPIFRHVRIQRGPRVAALGGMLGVSDESSYDGYLDIVALGTSNEAVHVAYVSIDNVEVKENFIVDGKLQRDGVLRFVMEGEAVNGNIPAFSRDVTSSSGVKSDAAAEAAAKLKQDEELIQSLRAELSHSHDVEEELRAHAQVHNEEHTSMHHSDRTITSATVGAPAVPLITLVFVLACVLLVAIAVAKIFVKLTSYGKSPNYTV